MMKRIPLREMLTLTMMGVLMSLGKWVLQGLPNIEIVSLLIMVCAYKFRWKTLIPIYIFVGLEFVQYGPSVWNIMYIYVWAVLLLMVLPLRRIRAPWVFALVSGGFGMCFGVLCSIPYIFAFGWQFALSWVISGLSFDALHGAGIFVAALMLYVPLTKALDKIAK